MAALALITFANVFVRYLTNSSFAWTEEISVFLLIILTMTAGATAFVRNQHIRIEVYADGGPPQRRRILTLLKGRERSVNELAGALRVSQPRVSKHLRVLREVGLVSVREAGQQRLYKLDARGLKPIHDWVGGFEEFWSQSFDRLNAYVKGLQRKEGGG